MTRNLPAKQPHLKFENEFWKSGIQRVAGLDEAGRGAWAGPVCAAAVIFSEDISLVEQLPGVRDSKLMTPPQRFYWATKIKDVALAWGAGFASQEEIDQIGILPATRLAMLRALEQLSPAPQHLLLDALLLRALDLPQTALIKGDQRSLSIAAASVLAKTSRDEWMVNCAQHFPGYGFELHKGYGTSKHQAALLSLGACPLHRRSFRPVKEVCQSGT
jgi:ribonuclease HII